MRLTPLPALVQEFKLLEAVGSVIFVLIVFLVVMYLAYVTSKLVGKRYSTAGKNMQLVETMAIGPNKQLYIIRVADKAILLAATKDGIVNLGELDPDKLVVPQEDGEPLDFAAALRKAAEERFGKNRHSDQEHTEKGAKDEDC